MAAPGENLLSVEHLSSMERNTLTKKRELLIKKRGMQLQQRLQELKERECRAQQDHRQLLLQFERAQDTLTEMLARNAAMKIIRMEYERYLEENFHRWQLELKEKTRGSQKTRMEDSLKSYLRHNKDQVSTATADQPLISQDPSLRVPKFAAPETYCAAENSACSQDNSSYYPPPDASWLTQAGLLHDSLRAPLQPQSPPAFPAANFLYSHPFLLQHPTSSFGHQPPWAMPEAAGLAPPRHSNPCADGIPQRSSSRLHTEEPSALRVDGEDEVSTEVLNRVRGGGGRRGLSPELDVQPVRLSSEHADSSESGRDSSLTSREKKKREKKGRAKSSSSESEKCASQKSSRTSSVVVAVSCKETNSSSEEGGTTGRRRTKRGSGLNTGSPPSEEEAEEQKRSEEDEKSVSLSETVRSPDQNSKARSCRGEEGSDRDVAQGENREEDIDDDEEAYSSDRSNAEEKDEEETEKTPGSGDEEKEVRSEEGGKAVEDEEKSDDEVPPTSRNGKKDVEEDEEDEENSDEQENEDGENREQDSSSSQGEDEEESEGGERIEQLDEEEEAGDSEDSIISPQKTRSKQMKNVPEEAAEDEEEETDTQSSNNSQESSDEEDIENLLAPQEPGKKKENAVKSDGKPKATCSNFGIFQATEDGAKTNHKSDSDEFDHFYD